MRISLKPILQIAGALLLSGGAFWTTYSWGRPSVDPDAGCLLLRSPDPAIAQIVADIAEDLPLDLPLEVRREPILAWGLYGMTTIEDGQYVIVLDSSLTAVEALSVLLHEYAHCVAWQDGAEDGEAEEDHGPVWGSAYSRTYLAWLQG